MQKGFKGKFCAHTLKGLDERIYFDRTEIEVTKIYFIC